MGVLTQTCLLAQQVIIQGEITDQQTGDPLFAIKVLVKDQKDSLIIGNVSDFDGLYKVTVDPGVYTIDFESVEYTKKRVLHFEAKPGVINTLNVELEAPVQLEEVMIVNSQKMSSVAVYSISMSPTRSKMNSKPAAPLYETYATESYDDLPENPFIATSQKEFSTFSIDVDKAGYSNVRRFIQDGQLPPQSAVRIEEMVNYFSYDYQTSSSNDDPVAVTSVYTECPWNAKHGLVHIGIQARKEDYSTAPPNNLVFLIDVSGSMQSPDKLDLLKAGLYELTNQLRPQDQVAIVTYAGASGLALGTTKGTDKTAIRDVLESLTAGGSTNGSEGIKQAYEVAQASFIQGGNNRIILATDGDFNLGVSDDKELVQLVEEKRKSDVYLTVLGFGKGNLQDSKMEKLADNGNGSYAYIDDLVEARKVLVEEIGGTLVTVAKDVKLQVQFNPLHVKGYRLIGYENRVLDDQDFDNDAKDAGDMGSGQTVTALYEIIPIGSEDTIPSLSTGAAGSRSPKKAEKKLGANDLAGVDLRYKAPGGSVSKLIHSETKAEMLPMTRCGTETLFAVAVAEFGMLLADSQFKGKATIDQVLELAGAGLANDKAGYRADFLDLVKKSGEFGLK